MDGRWDFRAGNGIDRLVENKEHFFLVIPEYKFFVSKKKLCSGYYLGASLMYMQDRSTDISRYPATATNPASNNYSTGVSNGYGAGLFNGVQFYIFGRITVDIQAGMMFYDLYYEGEDYGGDWFPRLAFNLGYRFGLGEKKLLERKPKPKPVEIPWD